MKTATRLLLLPVLALLTFAANARGQATATAYSNLQNVVNTAILNGATATGGSTTLIADDLTYDASLAGQAVSAFQVSIANNNSISISVTPTVIFWNSDGAGGGPGTLLGSYVLPLATFPSGVMQTLPLTVPATQQFLLPASGTIWAGIYVTGTATTTADQLNHITLPLVDPPTIGSSQDRVFASSNPGPAAASNPAGMIFTAPFSPSAKANYGWELTTTIPGTLDVLDNFPASGLSDAGPGGALLLAADGNYYGTTIGEGAAEIGTIFQLTPGGTVNTIFEFSGANGAYPNGALIQGNDGLLYGTTYEGGQNGNGTIFSIPTGSTTQALKVLHSFGPGDITNADGSAPRDALIQARDGNFYGVARNGGAAGHGTVFRITPAGTFTLLASFGSDAAAPSLPSGALIEDADGNLVGTSLGGGEDGDGAVFQLTLAGNLTTLDSLTAANSLPSDQLVLGADGNFYGVSLDGGANNHGTVFLATPGVNGMLTTLASFGADIPQTNPDGPLLMASDGNFYGLADQTGLSIYGVTPGVGGTLNFEQILDGSAGSFLPTPLIQGSDGNLYGATEAGGTGSNGTVYRLTTALPPVVQFSQSEYAVNEFAGTATIRVDRIGGTDAISVNYITEDGAPSPFPDDGNATAGTDYQSAAGTLHWAAGDQTPKFFTVQIIDQGATAGGLRTLSMQLNSPQGSAGLGFQNTATLTINDSVQYAPVITSAVTATATQGVAFSYQIVGINRPAGYTVSGLTDGFTLNSTTGLISGTPTDPGELDLTLHATNAIGTASAPLTITIAPSPRPTITSFSPASGAVGSNVVIQGTNFIAPLTVTFAGGALAVHGFTSTVINAAVPAGASSGPIKVTTSNGSVSTASGFTVTSPPTITSFSPASAAVGATVTINGTNFQAPLSVIFPGNKAAVHGLSATQINAQVPSGTLTGPVKVVDAYGTISTAANFTVLAPTITSFSPASGVAGTMVTIKGTNFVAPLSVIFGGNAAAVHGFTSTVINAILPSAAVSGPIRVNTNSGSVSTSSSFTDTSPPAISSFSPGSGKVGATVVIKGTGFQAPLSVIFTGNKAAVHGVSATQINATVPSGALTGAIKVNTSYGSVSTASNFNVTP